MSKELNDWPNYFPESCPPKEAASKNIKVYRFVRFWPTNENDFIPYGQKRGPSYYKGKECISCGLSVFGDPRDAVTMFKLQSGKIRKNKNIAIGLVPPESGKILNTPTENAKSHLTWWIFMGIQPHKYFNELLQNGES